MNVYWWILTLNYVLVLAAIVLAAKANSKVNDHYENDHTDLTNSE